MPMQVILLERVDNLGALGDVVSVKPGYARNYLIPNNKALRATKDNVAYFEARKKEIEKQNETKRKDAEKLAEKLKGANATLLRLASEDGQLYGSVNSRDIAEAVAAATKMDITRTMVVMNQNYKLLGLFPVTIALHPEVKVDVTINIARSEEEAKIQLKTGKALVADDSQHAAPAQQSADKAELMDTEALEAEKEWEEEEAKKSAEKAEKTAKKSQARAGKKAAAKAEDAAEEAEEAEGETEE